MRVACDETALRKEPPRKMRKTPRNDGAVSISCVNPGI